MTPLKNFIKDNPVLTYFALTFIFTWGCMALAIACSDATPILRGCAGRCLD